MPPRDNDKELTSHCEETDRTCEVRSSTPTMLTNLLTHCLNTFVTCIFLQTFILVINTGKFQQEENLPSESVLKVLV